MRDKAREEAVRRLKSVEGHVRGVAKMVEEKDVTYAEIVQQTSAVFSAMKRINTLLLKDLIEESADREGLSEDAMKEVLKAVERVTK
ncbi:metal-sensitive transcriptional regulator [Rubrobacter indicoceani]|uniref:metal-sensitive transcriptional regulator n=1 Tax=Rubrobacter indicoceani TaxID=2051957 RepID=UPI000E5BE99E|nr:metal-sensitive transcriptional regulator [Rubrobacter indicoceani]